MTQENVRFVDDVPLVQLRSGGERSEENAERLFQTAHLSSKPPKDRLLGVFFILVLHGCAIIAPWIMLMHNCYPHFVGYKLDPDYANKTGKYTGPEVRDWQDNFCHRITVACQVPNIIFTLLNCFVQFGEGTLGIRVVVSLLLVVASSVVIAVLAIVDTSESLYVLVYVSLIVVVIMMAAVGVNQNSIWGLVAPLPMRYANAIVIGNNVIGFIVVLLPIVTRIISPIMKIDAISYFMIGIFLLLAAFVTCFALPHLKFYRYHNLELKKRAENAGPRPTCGETMLCLLGLMKNLAVHYWNVFITFYVTFFAFPNVVMWIKAMPDEDFFIGVFHYTQVLCFLTFNVCAFLGNLIPTFLHHPKPRYLWIFTTARILFIPFFLLLNFSPMGRTRRFPVLIGNSWIYWIAMVLFSLSHGHASSLAMMYAPKQAESHNASKAGMLAGAILVLGVNSGLITSAVIEPIMLLSWKSR